MHIIEGRVNEEGESGVVTDLQLSLRLPVMVVAIMICIFNPRRIDSNRGRCLVSRTAPLLHCSETETRIAHVGRTVGSAPGEARRVRRHASVALLRVCGRCVNTLFSRSTHHI